MTQLERIEQIKRYEKAIAGGASWLMAYRHHLLKLLLRQQLKEFNRS